MKIAVIGSGNVGRALVLKCLHAGFDVLVGVKYPWSEKSQLLANEIGPSKLQSIQDACSQSEMIIVATPAHVVLSIIPLLGDVTNKIIIDTTNAVRLKPEPYATAFEAIKKLTKSEAVIKCFNTTGFENLLNPSYGETAIDLFAAGNHQPAKAQVIKLAGDLGFGTCYDFGGDDKVELQEQLALSWINLAIMQGHGRNLGFKLLKREEQRF
jgi:hypothetical protein